MAAIRGNARLQVGTSVWILDERSAALQIAEAETEEFTFSARNELDWLNEHMAEIFNENELNVAEIFKTPGKLRGKTPRTARKRNPLDTRAPLSDVFSTTPRAAASSSRQVHQERASPKFRVAEDVVEPAKQIPFSTQMEPPPAEITHFDSGYHGSQASVATEFTEHVNVQPTTQPSPAKAPPEVEQLAGNDTLSEERRTTEGSYQSAQEEQTLPVVLDESAGELVKLPGLDQPRSKELVRDSPARSRIALPSSPTQSRIAIPVSQAQSQIAVPVSPAQSRIARPVSPQKTSPERKPLSKPVQANQQFNSQPIHKVDDVFADAHSDSDSPARPAVRKKSSLNFASLPAREPLTSNKSIGNRNSRTSHLDQTRASYYGRHTGGKSLGSQLGEDRDDEDEIEGDHLDITEPAKTELKMTQIHNKTYTQRLQDQISMLGQSQSNTHRPSKSIPNIGGIASQSTLSAVSKDAQLPTSPSRIERPFAAPGAFPDDEEDDWIGPPTAEHSQPSIFNPRAILTKSHTTDVLEGVHRTDAVSGADFSVPKQRRDDPRQRSPFREQPFNSEGATAITKSVSASAISSPTKDFAVAESVLQKPVSVSNPTLASKRDDLPKSPAKSPSKNYRESPLKAAKAHLSSILKSSKGLFASSAAVSAGAMASTLSPPPARVDYHAGSGLENGLPYHSTANISLYPSLHSQSSHSLAQPESPTRKGGSRKGKEKEAQVMASQLDKLGKEREKEAEKARVFSQQERERVAAMERQVAAQKEQERLAKEAETRSARTMRSSPRRTKAQQEVEGRGATAACASQDGDENVEMTDATAVIPRATVSQVGKSKEQTKRPIKPSKEPLAKAKQAPVVIRVNTGFRPFQPSTAALAASLQDSLPPPALPAAPPASLRSKQTGKSLHPKASTESIRSFASSTTKVKALEAAARKKEQDDREAQRKREAKQELASQIDAKKNAQKSLEKKQQLERAKQDRPPPPATRPTPVSDLEQAISLDKPLPPPPPQRGELGHHRPQEDLGKSVNSFQNTTKAPPKRPLPGDEAQSRPILQRAGPSYQQNDNKRRKTLEDQDQDMSDAPSRGTMAPPIRQSNIRQKDGPTKSLFPSGYVNAPQPSHGPIHKVPHAIPPHLHQSKPAHPMDMVQNSKATINFAPNPAHIANPSHKTPARPGAPPNTAGKSTSKTISKSSPRYQNGENIDLPEIHTDSEDENSDGGAATDFAVPDWANSPALRAGIMRQEGIDPASIFGPPGELKMEEVFKNKERWGRFRARTSSANWSGSDRLTEEEVQRDLLARERLRREGGWSYGLS